MKLTSRMLRDLVLETVKEVKQEKNISARKRHLKSIIETVQKTLEEEADPGKVDSDRFPLELSAAAAKAPEAEKLVTGGDEDGEVADDVVNAKPGSMSVKELKPSQSSMDIGKACAFAIAAILKVEPFENGPGGDLGAIITSDNHIMDGHHRWIATGMVDPAAQVGGYIVEFPAKQMIAALNMITVKLGITQGKKGSGGFDQFNESGILAVLQDYASNGVWSAGGDPAKVMQALETFSGKTGDEAITEAAKMMGDNVSMLTLSVPGGFPARPDMPVISKKAGHLAQAIELLRSGQVDLNEPYADSTPASAEVATEGLLSKDIGVIVERWNTLAGILKD